ncbi:MAG TPA: hypothetical protein VMS08_04165 [Candidatus Saccharimonadia bacterium]|nr:hypothetical protein [Candidatus Saccharimonadia bacterium]
MTIDEQVSDADIDAEFEAATAAVHAAFDKRIAEFEQDYPERTSLREQQYRKMLADAAGLQAGIDELFEEAQDALARGKPHAAASNQANAHLAQQRQDRLREKALRIRQELDGEFMARLADLAIERKKQLDAVEEQYPLIDGSGDPVEGAEPPPADLALTPEASGRVAPSDARSDQFRIPRSQPAPRGRIRRWHVITALVAVVLLVVGVITIVALSGGPSVPASALTVMSEIPKACDNINEPSEPGEVNFACAKDTDMVLWAFAVADSHDDPNFVDAKTGREGLDPITPAQGGEIAWGLNLHHPYDPANPMDSLEVGARAINNIIAGATLTGEAGKPVVQGGLESQAPNCLRYTGSPSLTSKAGYPDLCARRITTAAGRDALVADVYGRWMPTASAAQARDVAILFQYATTPGNPQFQTVLKQVLRHRLP